MENTYAIKEEVSENGFAVMNDFFTGKEIEHLLEAISQVDTSKPTIRKTTDLFAIRQFLKEVQQAAEIIFNKRLTTTIAEIFGNDFFVVKSIYFDKPESSNWFVAYHQDLTISVDKKIELEGFGP